MALPLLLGHRGARASTRVPENTFASFDLALKHGCDGFEFDVRLTACGAALVCHDSKIDKVTVARAHVNDLPQLPQLSEVIQRYGQRAFLDIELKVEDLESKVLGALSQYPPTLDFVVSSFIPDVVMDLEARSSSVPIGIICETQAQLARWRDLPVDFVIPHQALVTRPLVNELQRAGLKILVWTVNEKETMLSLADWGVDGIISDDTELLVRTLKRKSG
ncbi:MAG: glycerophosphodiester phosphodiesterase [Terriglobales bacterium]